MLEIKKRFQTIVPKGWRIAIDNSTLRLYSPNKIQMLPLASAAFQGKTDYFELEVHVGELLSNDKRQHNLAEYVPPRTQADLSRKQPWIPDFYDDKFGYRIEYPGFMPRNETDLKAIVGCYERLRRHWKVYDGSKYADKSHFWTMLSIDGSPPKGAGKGTKTGKEKDP